MTTGVGSARGMAAVVGRAMFGLAIGAVGLVGGVIRMVAVVVLHLTKPFILYPLVLLVLGGAGAAVAFGFMHQWRDVGQAVMLATGAWLALMVYHAIASRLDPNFFDRTPLPPWWWYF